MNKWWVWKVEMLKKKASIKAGCEATNTEEVSSFPKLLALMAKNVNIQNL